MLMAPNSLNAERDGWIMGFMTSRKLKCRSSTQLLGNLYKLTQQSFVCPSDQNVAHRFPRPRGAAPASQWQCCTVMLEVEEYNRKNMVKVYILHESARFQVL